MECFPMHNILRIPKNHYNYHRHNYPKKKEKQLLLKYGDIFHFQKHIPGNYVWKKFKTS